MPGWERWLLLGLLGLAALSDLRTRRVPNLLVLVGAVLAVSLAGRSGWGLSLAGMAVGGLPLLLPYAKGWMGAGDVKLSAMVGGFVGPLGALWVLLWTALAGGVLALVYLLRRRVTGKSGPLLPYAVAIALGTAVVLTLKG